MMETRKNIERQKELRRERKLLYNILATIPAALLVLDKHMRIKSANLSFYKLFQAELEKTIGSKIADVLEDKDGKFSTKLAKLFGTEDKLENYELRCQSVKLGERILDITARGAIITEEEQLVVIIQDITERKQAEELLRENEGKTNAMLQAIGDHMSMLDKDLNILWANQTAKKIFGDDIIGEKCYKAYHGREEPCEPQPCITLKTFQDGKVHEHDTQVIDKDGRTIYFHCTANVALRDEERNPSGVIEISRDITERKQAEERIHHLNLMLRAIRKVNQLISRVQDREKLISEVCDTLIETRGYYNVWIVLLDDTGKPVAHSESGLGRDFLPMAEKLKRGELAACARKALGQPEILLIESLPSVCTDCPLAQNCSGGGAMVIRLEADGKIYGFLSASIPITFINERDETILFKEVAQDVAIALRSIEFSEKHQQAVAALQRSDENYQDLYKNAPIVYLSIDTAGYIVQANKEACSWLGYSLNELIGKYQDSIYAEGCAAKAKSIFERFKRGKLIHDEEVICQTKDGQEVYGLLSVSPITDESGEITASRSVVKDITQRKSAEAALLKAEENFHNSMDNSPLGVRILTAGGKTLYVNKALLAIYGYKNIEEFNKTPAIERYTSKGYSEHQARKEKRRLGETLPERYTINMVRKDGEIHNLEILRTEVIWNGNTETQVLYRDVTDRDRAQEELRQSEAKYVNLVENGNDGIIILQEGLLKYANTLMFNTLGFRMEEVLEKPFIDFVAPMDRELVAERYEKRMAEENVPNRYEIHLISKDGREIPTEISASSIEYQGKPADMAIIRDISERKQAETERTKFEQKAQLSSRLASIGQMSAGIAHEINNPLTSVIGFTDLLMMRKDLPDNIKGDLEIIHDGSRRVSDIVKRLLAFARQDKVEKELVDINEIIETTLALRAYEMETGNIEVKTYLDPDLPNTAAASGQLQQVFLNLIINAEEEMKKAHNNGNLLIKTETVDDAIRISFQDDGPGIAKKDIDRIFEPFFTTKEPGEGTGLGLSVCYGIVTDHNGQIYAESKKGNGATFIVVLPVVSKESQMALAEGEAEETEKVIGAKILIVDDEPGVRQFLSRLLAEEGYDVETVDNASDALEKIEQERYNLILMDIKMPEMSGIELYQRIRKTARSLANRVVFITGDIMAADTESFLSRSKASYINKPFDANQLKKEIARILSQQS